MTRSQLISMCEHNMTDGNDGVHIAEPGEKRVVRAAEKAGLVRIVETGTKCAGFEEWRVFLVVSK